MTELEAEEAIKLLKECEELLNRVQAPQTPALHLKEKIWFFLCKLKN